MRLTVTPEDGLADETPVIRVTGVAPGARVELRSDMLDAGGRPWRSTATFAADGQGQVDTATAAPTEGTWRGQDPAGPWWSMQFMDQRRSPSAFLASDDALTATVTATSDGQSVDQQVRRRWRRGSRTERLDGDGFHSLLFVPEAGEARPGVLVVPGATGVAAMAPMAALLASHGFAAAVVGYMENNGLPSALQDIPIEVLASAGDAVARHPSCEDGPLGVVCASVGTEGALSALAHLDAFSARATVAISPSHVVWQALPAHGRPVQTASWSFGGKPLPWVPMHPEKLLGEMFRHRFTDRFSRHPKPKALHMRAAFESGLHSPAAEAAVIPVERIAGPLLLIAGGDDEMWPSKAMAEAIATRRRHAGVSDDDVLLVYDEAGHFIRPPLIPTTVPWNDTLVSGGEPQATALAQQDAWARVISFLQPTAGPRPS